MRAALFSFGMSFVLLLAACGGGGGGVASLVAPPDPPPVGFAGTPSYSTLQAKMAAGETITVAFLGGSITVGATTQPLVDPGGGYDFSSYDREQDSWRALVFEHLRQNYEVASGQFQMVNASLSGTGSDLAAFRFARDVADRDPDLVFIEFAVNDTSRAPGSQDATAALSIQRALVSIVEQARADNPDVAVFMSISTVRRYYEAASANFVEARRMTMDTAIHLGVPFADLTTAFFDSELPPTFEVTELYAGPTNAGNSLHPSPAGHQVYALHVAHVLDEVIAEGGFVFPDPVEELPADLAPWPVDPTFVTPSDLSSTPGFSVRLNEEDWERHPIFQDVNALFVDGAGVTLERAFVGSSVAVWWEWNYFDGPIEGAVQITLDGIDLGSFVSSVADPATEQRLSRFLHLGTDLDPNQVHTVELFIPGVQPPQLSDLRLATFGLCIDEGF